MTPTTDELRALVERLDNPPEHEMMAVLLSEAAAALRLWIAERERETLDATQKAMDDMVAFGTGATFIDLNGNTRHVPFEELKRIEGSD